MLLHQRAVLRIQDMATLGRCQEMKSVQVRSLLKSVLQQAGSLQASSGYY